MKAYTTETSRLMHCDAMVLLKSLDDNSVDAIITDPPYFRVKTEDWDNQWASQNDFITWLSGFIEEFSRVLKRNGSFYLFMSSKMAAAVELEISKRFDVLNHLVWRKGKQGYKSNHWGQKTDKELLRSFYPETERIIFAEHYNSDSFAENSTGYYQQCEKARGFIFEPLRAYFDEERIRAGVSITQIQNWFASHGLPKYMTAGHTFKTSQWQLPTEKNYLALRACFNQLGKNEFLKKDYEFLKKDYEFLKKDYEELKKDYEELRRPFNVSANSQWGDIWEFETVPAYPGKHPCEKPLPLLFHILETSTKKNALVLDPFTGSGSLAEACIKSGRQFLGSEKDEKYYNDACTRLEFIEQQSDLFTL